MSTAYILIMSPQGETGALHAARTWPHFPRVWDETTRLEASLIAQVARLAGDDGQLLTSRPFRAPHHTVGTAGLVGGGLKDRPGEVSLAHGGTLLLDQIQEFRMPALEELFTTLRHGVARMGNGRIVKFPASPSLVIGILDPRTSTERRSKIVALFTEAQAAGRDGCEGEGASP